jgi:hypothetical protein
MTAVSNQKVSKALLFGAGGSLFGGPITGILGLAVGGVMDIMDACNDQAESSAPPQWNAAKSQWEPEITTQVTPPTPTRATTSQWVDEVDPDFQ